MQVARCVHALQRLDRAAWRWRWAPATSASRARLCALATRRPIGAQRRRRQRRTLARRKGRIARQARDAEVFFDLLVVGLQVFVGQRPVVGHAVERADAKVRRHVPLPVGREQDAAAAHGVVEDGRDVRVGIADRIVGRRLPPIGIARPIAAGGELEVGVIGPGLGVVGPIALLQDDDAHARFGQPLGRHRPGRPGADNQDIGGLGHKSIGEASRRKPDVFVRSCIKLS